MDRRSPRVSRPLSAVHRLAFLALLSCSGCGTGEYLDRMSASEAELGALTALNNLLYGQASNFGADGAGEETGITLRLPQFVGQTTGNDQPPFVQLPGYSFCYIVEADDGGGTKWPMYIYLAAIDAGSQQASDLETQVQSLVAMKFPDAVWEDIDLTTPTGGTISMRVMRVSGTQSFKGVDLPGQMNLYLFSTSNHHALIGWRAPQSVATRMQFFEAAEACMGTVSGP